MPSSVDKASELGPSSHRDNMEFEMEFEEETVNAGHSGAAAFTNEGPSFKKPLFKPSLKEKKGVAAKTSGYLSRENYVSRKPATDVKPDPRIKGTDPSSQWFGEELVENGGVLEHVAWKLPQVHDTRYEEVKKAHSRFHNWSDEDWAEYMAE